MSQFQNNVDKLVKEEKERLLKERESDIQKMINEDKISPMTECAYGKSVADLETNNNK